MAAMFTYENTVIRWASSVATPSVRINPVLDAAVILVVSVAVCLQVLMMAA